MKLATQSVGQLFS